MLDKDLQERNQIIKQVVLEQCAVREKLPDKKNYKILISQKSKKNLQNKTFA